jgi:DNA-binding MarR family transcriptional regulator
MPSEPELKRAVMESQSAKMMDLIFRLKSKCIENETEIMKESQLSRSEFNGIERLNAGELISGKLFSEKLDLSPSRASRIVERMVQKGFLVRNFDSSDRRKCQIALSDKGLKVKRQIKQMRSSCERKFEKMFSPQEIESFSQSIKKTIKIL